MMLVRQVRRRSEGAHLQPIPTTATWEPRFAEPCSSMPAAQHPGRPGPPRRHHVSAFPRARLAPLSPTSWTPCAWQLRHWVRALLGGPGLARPGPTTVLHSAPSVSAVWGPRYARLARPARCALTCHTSSGATPPAPMTLGRECFVWGVRQLHAYTEWSHTLGPL